MTKLNEEVAFLKRLGKRFKTRQAYIGVVEDLYNEGMITKKAYETVRDEKVSKKQTNVKNTDPCSIQKNPCSIQSYCTKNYYSDPCHSNNSRC